MRKRILTASPESTRKPSPVGRGLDLERIATVVVTSESDDYPIENAFDGRNGPGGSRWIAGEPGDQTLILELDEPQNLERVVLEVEERQAERTQELALAVSRDGGATYEELVRQEYNFSPNGSTFEREGWSVRADGVTHVRLSLRPEKGGKPHRATITALELHGRS